MIVPRTKCKQIIQKRLPILKWLPHYTFSTFLQDLIAGLTVGMTEIPQGIAYAAVAGLPPEYGLYSGLADGFIYALLGGCKDLNIGPGSLLSLLIAPSVASAGPQAAVLMTFLSGVLILVLGVLQLGFVINFFSYPITTGFISTGVVLIVSGQIVNILGLSSKGNSLVDSWSTIVGKIHETRTWDLVLGLTSLVVLLALKALAAFGTLQDRRDWPRWRNAVGKFIFGLSLARSAVVLVVGTWISYYFREEQPFKTAGDVDGSFPSFRAPAFSTTFDGTHYDFGGLVAIFNLSLMFIPLVSILEALTMIKTFNKGQKIDSTQEMLALGLCNVVGSFVGSMPVTGCFSRSTINRTSGVRTTMGGVFTSLLLLLSIGFLTSTFRYVPKATLAAILINSALYVLEYRALVLFWRYKKLDMVLFLVTFVVGLFLGADYGILVGACLHCLFVLYGNARPKLGLTKEKDGERNIFVVTPRHTLHFPCGDHLRDKVLECEGEDVTVVINGEYIRSMDVTVARSLTNLIDELLTKNYEVVLRNFKESVKKLCVGVDKKMKDHFMSEEDQKMRLKGKIHDREASVANL